MKGHICERPPGSSNWYAVIDVRDPATGKRKRRFHSLPGCSGKRKAQLECARLIAELQRGVYIEPSRTTLADYLSQWLEHVKGGVAPRTHERYAEIVAKYIVPALGNVILTKLQAPAISAAYDKIKAGRTKGQGELSARSMLHIHRILSAALARAVRWRLLPYNPASDAKRYKIEHRKPATHSLTEAVDVLELLRGSWIHVPALLGILCGLRRGEIAALRWGSVDLDKRQLAVAQTVEKTKGGMRYKEPKSGKIRTVALSPSVVTELRAHRARQAEQMLRLGVRLGDEHFVVAQANGSPYDPDSITKEWRLRIIKSGLPRIRFHDTRHTHGSHMLASGVHPKIASERLGHSRVGVTLDLYSHVVEGIQERAVELVDGAIADALQKRGSER